MPTSCLSNDQNHFRTVATRDVVGLVTMAIFHSDGPLFHNGLWKSNRHLSRAERRDEDRPVSLLYSAFNRREARDATRLVRDYRDMATFPGWGAYTPGLTPVFAISVASVILGILGHGTMRLVARPGRPWEPA
jgi:hypothetical protein